MALEGVPTKVAIPPMLLPYATDKTNAAAKFFFTPPAKEADGRDGDRQHDERDRCVADPHGKQGGCQKEGRKDRGLARAGKPQEEKRQSGVKLATLHPLRDQHAA